MIPLGSDSQGVIPLGNDSPGGDSPEGDPGGRFPWGTIPLGDDSPGGRFPRGKDPPWPNGRGRGSRFLAVAGSNPPPMLGVTLVSLWGHLGVILGSSWGNFGITLGSFWGHFGIILGSFWDHFGINLGSFWDHVGIDLGSIWGHVGIVPSRPNGTVARTGRSPERPDSRQNGPRQIGASSEARLEVPPGWPERQNGQNARTPER